MESIILSSSMWVYRPSLRRWESIPASEARIRMASCSLVISRLKTPQVWPDFAALTAMLTARLLFPMEGRAPRMIRSARCSPPRYSSRSGNPDMMGIPENSASAAADARSCRYWSYISLSGTKLRGWPVPPDGEQGVLGLPHGGLDVLRVGVAQVYDPVAGVDQPSHARGSGDDLRVVLGVDRRGGDGHQVGQVGHAAHQDQLLRAGQLSGQGYLVHGLVALEQAQGCVEAELVPFPVEGSLLQEWDQAGEALAVDQD